MHDTKLQVRVVCS